MKPLLPRSRPRTLPVAGHIALALILRHSPANAGIIPRAIFEDIPGSILESLQVSGFVILSDNHLADCSRVRRECKREADRNRQRAARRLPADHAYTTRLIGLFPQLAPPRQPVRRPASYIIPEFLKKLIEDSSKESGCGVPQQSVAAASRSSSAPQPPSSSQPSTSNPQPLHSCHRKARPADVEEFAGPFYPGELGGLLQTAAEQRAAHREVWLLYTRKAAFLGIRRRLHTPV